MPEKKSKRIGMAMETVVTTQLWSHVWVALDAFPPDAGSMLPPLDATGGSTMFLGLGLVVRMRGRDNESRARLYNGLMRDS